MSTTRHLINRRRRLAATAPPRERAATTAAAAVPTTAEPGDRTVVTRPRPPRTTTARTTPAQTATARTATARTAARAAAVERLSAAGRAPRRPRPRPVTVLIAGLAVLTVLLGCLAAWSASKASGLRDSADTGNTALTDTARTSEVKGTVAQAVNAVFSYNYADAARTDDAARRVLTGKAVQQYATMLAQVRAQAPAQKLVLTTTVTDTGVELLDGDRARVLVFADQSNTSTAKSAKAATTYAAAMFTVDAVHQDGTWKIASIDTFG